MLVCLINVSGENTGHGTGNIHAWATDERSAATWLYQGGGLGTKFLFCDSGKFGLRCGEDVFLFLAFKINSLSK